MEKRWWTTVFSTIVLQSVRETTHGHDTSLRQGQQPVEPLGTAGHVVGNGQG